MLSIINFIFYSFIIVVLNISNKYIVKYKKIIYEKNKNINNKRKQLILHGVTSLYENKLLTISNDSFINWCKDYLLSIGYTNVEIIDNDVISIYCYKNYKKYFVLCFKTDCDDSQANKVFDYYFILLGKMLSMNINNGIIISIDGINQEFKDYLSSFSNKINIEFHDKDVIIDNCLKHKISV